MNKKLQSLTAHKVINKTMAKFAPLVKFVKLSDVEASEYHITER